jgi:hypothetical protein
LNIHLIDFVFAENRAQFLNDEVTTTSDIDMFPDKTDTGKDVRKSGGRIIAELNSHVAR